MANQFIDDILRRLKELEKSLNETIVFVYKDNSPSRRIYRKKVDFMENVDFKKDVAFSSDMTFTGTNHAINTTNIGFFSVTPVSQQADFGSTSFTTVSGTGDDATINSNFSTTASKLNSIRTILQNLGLMA